MKQFGRKQFSQRRAEAEGAPRDQTRSVSSTSEQGQQKRAQQRQGLPAGAACAAAAAAGRAPAAVQGEVVQPGDQDDDPYAFTLEDEQGREVAGAPLRAPPAAREGAKPASKTRPEDLQQRTAREQQRAVVAAEQREFRVGAATSASPEQQQQQQQCGRKAPAPRSGGESSPPKRARAAAASGGAREQDAGSGAAGSKQWAAPAPVLQPSQASAVRSSQEAVVHSVHGRQQDSVPPPRHAAAAGHSGGCAAAGSGGGGRRGKGSGPMGGKMPATGRPGGASGGGGDRRPSSQQQVASAASGGGGSQAVGLPTLRRPGSLAPAGLLATATEARPAQTVMEAQERGELVQMQDDARYAMDGLGPSCSIDTQRESAVALTDMLCSRKGRLALRADGLTQQVLSSLAKLKASKDGVLGMASALVLLALTSDDAHPAYLASVAAAVLIDQLLQSQHTFEEVGGSGAPGAKLVSLLKGRSLSSLLASTGASSQQDLLLVTLEHATSSQSASKAGAVERLKHNLRQYGALARLGRLAADAAADAAASAPRLHQVLLVLENATFTCQDNGEALVRLQVGAPGAAGSQQQQQQQPFPAVLVAAAQQLLGALEQPRCRDALHVCLSVLMNLSHQNPEGAAAISAAGGLEAAAATISHLLGPSSPSRAELCKQVLAHLELVSVALGLLINLVSGEPSSSRRLASAAANAAVGDAPGLVALMCAVVSAVGELLHQQQQQQQQQQQGAGGEGEGQEEAAAGIVEVYCGMLLGFLVRDCPELAAGVARMLDGGSLQPIVGAVQRCLSFYVSTGAITDHTRATLEELLAHLSAAAAAVAPAGG